MQKIPNNHYFIAWADYEDGTCTRCSWGPVDHGHDSERGKDFCVFERCEES